MQVALIPDAALAAVLPTPSPTPHAVPGAPEAFRSLVDDLADATVAPATADEAERDTADLFDATRWQTTITGPGAVFTQALTDSRGEDGVTTAYDSEVVSDRLINGGRAVAGEAEDVVFERGGERPSIATATDRSKVAVDGLEPGTDLTLQPGPGPGMDKTDNDLDEVADATKFVALTLPADRIAESGPTRPGSVNTIPEPSLDTPEAVVPGHGLQSVVEETDLAQAVGSPDTQTAAPVGDAPTGPPRTSHGVSDGGMSVDSVAAADTLPLAQSAGILVASALTTESPAQASHLPTIETDAPEDAAIVKSRQRMPSQADAAPALGERVLTTETQTPMSEMPGGRNHDERRPVAAQDAAPSPSVSVSPAVTPQIPHPPLTSVPIAMPSPSPASPSFETPMTDDGQPVSARLIETLTMQQQQGGGRAEIRLRPEWMGPITVSLRMDKGEVTAVVRAESAAAADHLVAETEHLRSALEARGLHLSNFEVRRESVHERDPREQRRRQPSTSSRHRTRNDQHKVFEVVV